MNEPLLLMNLFVPRPGAEPRLSDLVEEARLIITQLCFLRRVEEKMQLAMMCGDEAAVEQLAEFRAMALCGLHYSATLVTWH